MYFTVLLRFLNWSGHPNASSNLQQGFAAGTTQGIYFVETQRKIVNSAPPFPDVSTTNKSS